MKPAAPPAPPRCLLALALAAAHARGERLRAHRGEGRLLCRLEPPAAGGGDRILEVWEQPGNVRLAEFQDTGSFESRVHCRGNAPTCPAADPSAATDVAACAACPCELDDSRDTSESERAIVGAVAPRCQSSGKKRLGRYTCVFGAPSRLLGSALAPPQCQSSGKKPVIARRCAFLLGEGPRGAPRLVLRGGGARGRPRCAHGERARSSQGADTPWPHVLGTAAAPADVLLLGLGGGVVHTMLRRSCPAGLRLRSAEIDPRFAAIASQFFGLPLEPGASEVVVGDALAVVRRELRALGARASAPALVAEGPGPAALGAAGWDAVVVDCFVGKGRSAELVDDIKGLLKPGGMVVHHMWHASPEDERVAPEFQATLQEYRRSFGPDRVEVQPIFRENPDLRLDDIILVHA